jgi:DHA2 family multidrug resistance protein
VLYPTLVRGVGLGLLVTPVMTAAINAVPTAKAGMASSMLSLIQQISGSLGIAVLACVLGRRATFHLAVVGQGMAAARPAFADATRALTTRALELGTPREAAGWVAHSLVARQIAGAASVLAFNDAFLVGAAIVGVGAIPALFLAAKAKARKRGTAPQVEVME